MRKVRSKVERKHQFRILVQTIRMVPQTNKAEQPSTSNHSTTHAERPEILKESMSPLPSENMPGKSQRLVRTISPTNMRELGTERKL